MNLTDVKETIKSANLYLTRLKYIGNELDNAYKQIENTYKETESNIQEYSEKLKQLLTQFLSKRETTLINKAKRVRAEALNPVRQRRKIVAEKIETTVKLISLGTFLSFNSNASEFKDFYENSKFLEGLLDIPDLQDVPYLSFYYEPSLETEIVGKIINLGDVYKTPPVKISNLTEKAGAILVEWKVIVHSGQHVTTIENFRLQIAVGDVTTDKKLLNSFQECYKGLDSEFLVKNVQIFQPYSFRVCCRLEGSLDWSPWSMVEVASTSIKHYTWLCQLNYEYSGHHRVAKPLGDNEDILYSKGAQISVGDSIDFIFLDGDQNCGAIVGLIYPKLQNLPKKIEKAKDGTFILNNRGTIIVNGVEKSEILPKFNKGSKVRFTCNSGNDNFVKVRIDCEGKSAIHDWPINPHYKMYFVAQFFSSKWTVMVK